jgi:hypothetical protein
MSHLGACLARARDGLHTSETIRGMAGRAYLARVDPGYSLPILERLAPPPAPELVKATIDRLSAPGDVVVDLHARGGWVARAAIDGQRRAMSIETLPLTRLLADLVLRPPDVRHVDAAFQAMSASPRGETSLRLAIADLFASRCATCGRQLTLDEVIWEESPDGDGPSPVSKHYRCAVCRDQQGGGEQRQAPLDDADLDRTKNVQGAAAARATLIDRFPVPEGAETLPGELLDLHTDRQLVALAAILERIEVDLRAAPIEAALRLAFLHAVLPSSRLAAHPGRVGTLRIASGHVRPPPSGQWRERNPWLAFEDGIRLVRGFIQRLEGGPIGSLQARIGDDIRSLADGPASVVLRLASPSSLRALANEARDVAHGSVRPSVRLVLAQPPARPSQERVALSFVATGWAMGRDAASGLPLEALLGSSLRAPWGWQAASLRRSLEAIEPLVARDGRVVLLLEAAGPEGVVAAALGGAGAGFRLASARLGEPDEDHGGVVELIPPGGGVPPAPRTRANVPLPPVPGGSGDADVVPGRGLFAPPERYDARPFSSVDAGRIVTETAVEVLRARGEPARTERLFGDILVGLDRSGLLRRLVEADGGGAAEPPAIPDPREGWPRLNEATPPGPRAPGSSPRSGSGSGQPKPGVDDRPDHDHRLSAGPAGRGLPDAGVAHDDPFRATRSPRRETAGPDQVERLVALIRDELAKPNQRRVAEIEPGRWWLAAREDQAGAATPLADRVEWAVYSLLSTAGSLSETAFFERIASLFTGHDLPDEALVRACLASYRSRASTDDRIFTAEDLLRRSQEHSELLAALASGGHRLGMQVWIGLREQSRRVGDRRLIDWLDDRERNIHLPLVTRAASDDLEAVDCIWYVRGKAAMLFEVEWTAMLAEPVLRRHARIPQDERIVRFLLVPPERTELVRHKLDRSPVLRAALVEGNWHILKWNHAHAFLETDPLDLANLEPFLGLDPVVERGGEQLPLFGGERYA